MMPVHVGAVFHLELMALPPVEVDGGGYIGETEHHPTCTLMPSSSQGG